MCAYAHCKDLETYWCSWVINLDISRGKEKYFFHTALKTLQGCNVAIMLVYCVKNTRKAFLCSTGELSFLSQPLFVWWQICTWYLKIFLLSNNNLCICLWMCENVCVHLHSHMVCYSVSVLLCRVFMLCVCVSGSYIVHSSCTFLCPRQSTLYCCFLSILFLF